MSGILVNFGKFEDIMKHNLGIVEPDENGDNWSYVQLTEDVGVGDVLEDSDFVSAGTITTAAGVGTNRLVDSGEFSGDDEDFIAGSVGLIHGHADGQGQCFYVKRWIDDDTLEVVVLADENEWLAPGEGWTEALTTSSQYSLVGPGVVSKGAASGRKRGVAQRAGKKSQFGFVKQTGLGLISIDGDGTALTAGSAIAAAAGSEADGAVAADLLSDTVIARAMFGDVAGTGSQVIVAELQIENRIKSYRRVDQDHAFNRNTIE